MEEIQISANLHLVAQVAKSTTVGQSYSILKFEVWLNSYEHDLDFEITDQFTTEKLQALKDTFLLKYEEQKDAEKRSNVSEAEAETERLWAEAEHLHDCNTDR